MNRLSISRRSLVAGTAAIAAAARDPRRLLAEATPVARGDEGSLDAMLKRASDPTPDGGPGPTTLFGYANIARQLSARGLRALDPARADDERIRDWSDGLGGLYVDDTLLRYAFSETLWDDLGFDPSQIDQTLLVGDVPRVTRLLRGRFDARAVARALAGSGYERIEVAGGVVFSSGREGEFSLRHPIQSLVLATLNNVAVVDESYVVAGAYLADVETALAVMAGNDATLASNVAVDTLVSAVGVELVSATVMDGAVLSAASMPNVRGGSESIKLPGGTIPAAAAVLFGLTPGWMPSRFADPDVPLEGSDGMTPAAEFVVALHLGSEAEAAEAVAVIEGRLAEGRSLRTNEPFATMFEGWDVTAVPGTPVATVRIRGERVGLQWLQIVFSRDLPFLLTD